MSLSAIDIVFNGVYKGSKNSGASESAAHRRAVLAVDDYKKKQI